MISEKKQNNIEKKINLLLEQMSLEEKSQLCHGCSSMEAGDIPRLNIPRIAMVDGPQGVRLQDGRTTTAMPSGISLACTWSENAAYEYGALLGREVIGSGCHVILGPGLNMMRTPLNGRNFEYFGEDPVLAGKIAAAYIRGCQSEGTAGTPKHLALNNQEICRTTGSSNIDERAMREVYLTAFEILAKEAQPWMMMSAYNKINGTYASACKLVQQEIVKDEWGFDGVMVSDWGAAHSAKGCAMGGLDLEMGQGKNSIMGKPLLELVRKGEVPETIIDEKVRRMLRLFFRLGLMEGNENPRAGERDTARHHEMACRFATEGMVLLKNHNILPLNAKKIKTLAVIGPNADFMHSMGPLEVCGGSGAVHPAYEITPLEGLRRYCRAKGIEVIYTPGEVFACNAIIPQSLISHNQGEPGLQAEYFHTVDEMESGKEPYVTMIDRNMQLDWSKNYAVAGAKADLPGNDFAVRWTGKLTPDYSGETELMAYCSHGYARVWVNGREIIATDQKMRSYQAGWKFMAVAGSCQVLKIEFVCTSAGPAFKLLWKHDAPNGCDEAKKIAEQADCVVFCGGTNHLYDKEAIGWGDVPGADIPDLNLPGRQNELIRELVAVNKNIVVALTNGSVVSVEEWIDQVPALLEMWYPGMEGGNALAQILFGEVNPGGKLCCTWGKKLNDYACHANGNYPGDHTSDHPRVNYDEGLFIGYRHFDRANISPRFPFGFGLSYTTFKIEMVGCKVIDASVFEPRVEVAVRVTNTGDHYGAEVVQLYVGDDIASLPRPIKELKGFRKIYLDAKASQEVKFSLNRRAFTYWSPAMREWEIEPGMFTIYVGNSAVNIIHLEKVKLTEPFISSNNEPEK